MRTFRVVGIRGTEHPEPLLFTLSDTNMHLLQVRNLAVCRYIGSTGPYTSFEFTHMGMFIGTRENNEIVIAEFQLLPETV